MISTRVIKCPICGHILTAIRRGYHCGWCDKYFIVAANMLFEERPDKDKSDESDILLDVFGLRQALEKLKEQR